MIKSEKAKKLQKNEKLKEKISTRDGADDDSKEKKDKQNTWETETKILETYKWQSMRGKEEEGRVRN